MSEVKRAVTRLRRYHAYSRVRTSKARSLHDREKRLHRKHPIDIRATGEAARGARIHERKGWVAGACLILASAGAVALVALWTGGVVNAEALSGKRGSELVVGATPLGNLPNSNDAVKEFEAVISEGWVSCRRVAESQVL